jgi:hypothetical protein
METLGLGERESWPRPTGISRRYDARAPHGTARRTQGSPRLGRHLVYRHFAEAKSPTKEATMDLRTAAASLSLALVLAACERPLTSAPAAGRPLAQTAQGSGLALHSVTGLSLPLIGRVGDVAIDQAIVTNIALVENTVGQIVGLQARGVLQLTGGVLGNDVVTQDFSTEATVTSTGTQCNVLSLDLGPITVDALVASIDVPTASVDAKASGAVGSLLCQLTGLLASGAPTSQVQSVVNTINAAI